MSGESKIVLVTGGAGFIGSAMSTALLERFDRVIAFDNLHPQIHPEHRPSDGFDERVEVFEADVTDPAAWNRLLESIRPTLVIHLAAETGTGQSLRESSRHTQVNVVGTSVMLDALQRNSAVPERMVLASSRAVYGEGAWRHTSGPHTGELFYPGLRSIEMLTQAQWEFCDAEPVAMNAELVDPHPSSVYGVTKLAQEQLLRLWCDAFGSEIGIVRLQNVYGPGQTPSNPYTGIMSLFCRLASEKSPIQVFEDGRVRRDFVIIDDVVRALLTLVDAEVCPDGPVDIGSGTYQTILQAAEIIAGIYDAPEPVVTGEWRHGDVRHAWADPEPAAALLGFRAQTGVHEGFCKLANWVGKYARSL